MTLAWGLLLGCPEPEPVDPSCEDPHELVSGTCQLLVEADPCPVGEMRAVGEGCVAVGVPSCAAGFERDASGWGCVEIAAEDCAPGTRPSLGSTECVAVGTTSCEDGFEADESGWGCAPILPEEPCDGATRAALGSTTCVPIGDCDADFPPVNATLFVDDDEGAPDATHFSTVVDALAAAQSGDVIAVEAGTYEVTAEIDVDIALVGRCAEQVRFVEGQDEQPWGLHVSADVELSGVTLSGYDWTIEVALGDLSASEIVIEDAENYGIYATEATVELEDSVIRDVGYDPPVAAAVDADDDASVTLTRVTVERTTMYGLHAFDAEIVATDVLVRDTATRPTDDEYGAGAAAESGSVFDFTRCAFVGNSEAALVAAYDSEVVFRDGVLSETAASAFGWGRGAAPIDGASVTIENSTIADNHEAGVGAQHDGSELVIRDSVVWGTELDPEGEYGVGALVETGATATFENVAFLQNHEAGVLARHGATTVEMVGCLVADARHAANVWGRGLDVDEGATLTAADTAVLRSVETGVLSWYGSTTTLTDVIVADTLALDSGDKGYALAAVFEGTLTCERCAAVRATDVAVIADGKRSRMTLADSTIRDTAPREDGLRGRGGMAQGGARMSLERVSFLDNLEVALVSISGSKLTLEDSSVVGTESSVDGRGFGVVAQDASATLSGVAVVENHEVGVLAYGPTGTLDLERVLVARTRGSAVFPDVGHGVLVNGGTATLSDVEILEQNQVALMVAGGRASSDEVIIADNPIGLHVQDGAVIEEVDVLPEDLEEERLYVTGRTIFLDNTVKVGSGELPVPELEE